MNSTVELPPASTAEPLLLNLARHQVEEFFRLARERELPLQTLVTLGRMLRLATGHPGFPDRVLAEAVEAKCRLLDIESAGAAISAAEADDLLLRAAA